MPLIYTALGGLTPYLWCIRPGPNRKSSAWQLSETDAQDLTVEQGITRAPAHVTAVMAAYAADVVRL